MSYTRLRLLYTVSLLSLTMATMSEVEAANITNGTTVTVPPTPDQAMFFTNPAPGGTFEIEAGASFSGALTNAGAGVGTLLLDSGSTLNGAVATGISPLLQINLTGNARIIGATSAEIFNLGQNTLTNTGALNLPSGTVINTKVVTNALFGNINAVTFNDAISGPSLTVNVDASGVVALTPGAPLFVINAGAGTSALPVIVTSNNVLYSFIGNNLNGNITIIPTINPAVAPPGGAGSILGGLLAVAAQNPGSDTASVVAALAALPSAAALENALLEMNPNVNGSLTRVSFDAIKQFTNLWSKHMGYGRCVYATNCDDDCSPGVTYPESQRDRAQPSESQQKVCDLKKENRCFSSINCPNVENRYELWGDAFGYIGHQDARQGFKTYNASIWGGMIGFQAPVNRVTSVGLGTGYARSRIHQHSVNFINTYDGTLYLSYDPTHWYVDTAFSFDWNQYNSKRHIDFTGIDRTAKAHYSGQQYSAVVASGYRYYTRWCGVITPLASLQYSHLHVNSYHEHGANSLDLHVKSQNYNFLESSLGLKLTQIVQTKSGAFVPEVHGLWLHDFFGDRMNLTSTFSEVAAQTGSFKTKGPGQDRNWGDVGGGITFISCSRLALELVYNYEFSKSYNSHQGLFKITQRF